MQRHLNFNEQPAGPSSQHYATHGTSEGTDIPTNQRGKRARQCIGKARVTAVELQRAAANEPSKEECRLSLAGHQRELSAHTCDNTAGSRPDAQPRTSARRYAESVTKGASLKQLWNAWAMSGG